jgi:hypothetical protein
MSIGICTEGEFGESTSLFFLPLAIAFGKIVVMVEEMMDGQAGLRDLIKSGDDRYNVSV